MTKNLLLGDKLALERTKLAIHRTSLAFVRTGMYFGVAGFTINMALNLAYGDILQWAFIIFGVAVWIIGYFQHKKSIRQLLESKQLMEELINTDH